MGAKDGYRMVMNLYHYVKDGVRPKPLQGTNNLVQNMCLAQIDRSKEREEIGRLGAEVRYGTAKPEKSKPPQPTPQPTPHPTEGEESQIPPELLESGLEIDPNDDMDELLRIRRAMKSAMEKAAACISHTRGNGA